MSSNPVPPGDLLTGTGSKPLRYIRFGPFQIDCQRQQVYRNGGKLRLHGKAYQVLLILIQKQGEIVTREELKQALWPADTHVNYDANVNTTVNKLRQALGESTGQPAYIETIPRRGYTFFASAEFSEVPFCQTPTASAGPAVAAPSASLPGRAAGFSNRRLTLNILGLILAGVLLGAVAALWVTHLLRR